MYYTINFRERNLKVLPESFKCRYKCHRSRAEYCAPISRSLRLNNVIATYNFYVHCLLYTYFVFAKAKQCNSHI